MTTSCPHCSQSISIDQETFASLQGVSHFDCPACTAAVLVPPQPGTRPIAPVRAPVEARTAIPRSAPSSVARIHRGMNRNLLILGSLSLLVLGGLAAFIASRKGGDVHNTTQNISNEIINNSYFQNLIASGVTTEKTLSAVGRIRAYGNGFIGLTREKLTWEQANDLAARTGSGILPIEDSSAGSKRELPGWIMENFSDLLGSTTWVKEDDSPKAFDSPDILGVTSMARPRQAFFRWQPGLVSGQNGTPDGVPANLEGLAPVAGGIPASWAKAGVVAEIKGEGEIDFGKKRASAYVFEIDLLIRNPHGKLEVQIGEPVSGLTLSLGDMWPDDRKQDKIPCRLFRRQPFGVSWNGERHFEPSQQLSLTLVVADDFAVLKYQGKRILMVNSDPADFAFKLVSSEGVDATIYRCAWRSLTEEEATKANIPFPSRRLGSDPSNGRARLAAQIDSGFSETPIQGKPLVVRDLNLGLRWVEPGEFRMGDVNAPFDQWGKGSEAVKITRGYWIGCHQVSQGQWVALMDGNPSRITGSPYLPVNWVSWSEASSYCRKLTERERAKGRCPEGYEYRLPTEAEWEHSCRSGGSAAAVIRSNRGVAYLTKWVQVRPTAWLSIR